MDQQTFDRLTRLVGTAASRRTALRMLLAGALLGATTHAATAAQCPNGKPACGESKECCPGKCFVRCVDDKEFCCTGKFADTQLDLIICGNRCCVDHGSADPCAECPPAGSGEACLEGIAGSYRRR
jgi:hypothetical protein